MLMKTTKQPNRFTKNQVKSNVNSSPKKNKSKSIVSPLFPPMNKSELTVLISFCKLLDRDTF